MLPWSFISVLSAFMLQKAELSSYDRDRILYGPQSLTYFLTVWHFTIKFASPELGSLLQGNVMFGNITSAFEVTVSYL